MLARSDVRGAALRARLTALADDVLTDLLGAAPGVALVAVGGYGRREAAPGSDLDLVLLHDGRRDVGEVAERVWYPIWDSGVPLDHAVRTVPEARSVARGDLKAALGLLDARHVAGDAALTQALMRGVREDWRRRASARLPELLTAVRIRAERYGSLAYLLEPDLKEAAGGLRDMHAMYATAAAWAADPPGGRVRTAYELLLDVRGELHRATGKGSDRLLLQEQGPVATALGLADADALLTSVSAAARTIAHAADHTWHRVAAWTDASAWTRRRGLPAVRRPLASDVVEQAGEVVLARGAEPASDPELVLRVASAAADAGLRLGEHTVERLAAGSAVLPEPWPAAARDALVRLLGAGASAVPVLESLDQIGFLVRLLPEWAAVRCRPQRNPVHRFTVDRHLMESAVQAAALTRRVTRPDLLLLAAFLHDIGKGYPGDHSVAGAEVVLAMADRLGFTPRDAGTLATLTRRHLLLVDSATRRDLDDPATVTAVAEAVGDRDTLDLLHALTEADAKATGAGIWTEWKADLVADLVRRTAAALAGRFPAPRSGPSPMARQLAAQDGTAVAVDVGPPYTVTVAAPDRPGLLSAVAGVLALHRLDVRSATAEAVGARAVTTCTVEPRFGSPPAVDRLGNDLRRAVEGRLDVASRLRARAAAYPPSRLPVAAPEVTLVDDASDTATVVDVRAHDAAGLLHRVTAALAGCGLDVRAALVSTFGAEAVDAFYVTGVGGALLTDPAQRDTVVATVLRALGAADPANAD